MSVETAASPRPPFALGAFGVTLGLAGLGGAWLAASSLLGAPTWPDEVLYGLSAALWVVFTFLYLGRGAWQPRAFRSDLTHPYSGPLTAYIPTVGILLAAHYTTYFPVIGRWVTVGFVVILAVLAAQLVAHWLMGNLQLDLIQGAYFIPVVAGPFVASIGLDLVGLHTGALWTFGAALFFWLSLGTIIMLRHMTGPKLPAPATPTAAAFLAASASASVAWIVAHPGPVDEVLNFFTGILIIMILVQVVLIWDYRKVPFSLSYWIFAFPVATTTNYLVRRLAASQPTGWQFWGWLFLGLGTAFIVSIGVATLASIIRRRIVRTQTEEATS